MDGLTEAIKRCNLQLKLDNRTEGFGNCFPNAIVQQCRRPEILTWLKQKNPIAIVNGQQCLRRRIVHFALKSRNKNISDLKTNYDKELQQVEKTTWTDYWKTMEQDGTWVDHMFVQVTAWFMKMDILILTTSSLKESPFIYISGNEISGRTNGPTILLGNYTNVHYQSLLPKTICKEIIQPKTSNNETEDNNDDFIYINNEKEILFKTFNNGKIECPYCENLFISIVKHVSTRSCKISQLQIERKEFQSQYDTYKEGYRLELNRKRLQKSRDKLLKERGPEHIKKQQNEWKCNSRKKLLKQRGHAQLRKEQTDGESKSRAKILEERGPEQIKKQQNKWKIKSRDKLLEERGPEQIRNKQKDWESKSRDKLLEEKGLEQIRKGQNNKKLRSRSKLIVEKGPMQIRKEQNEFKAKSREKLIIEKGIEQIRLENRNWKLKSRKRKLQKDPSRLLKDERKRLKKSRIIDSEKKRLKKFREKTLYNAIFTCSCCQRNLFDCNVSRIDDKLIAAIETKKPGLIKKAIEYMFEININGNIASYICHACKNHLKSGKLPPMSALNGLKMDPIDPDMDLSELEGNLIAMRIVFMKIFQLPKSRWTALKDKIINVPINEKDIINTITNLPRTPMEAGLIEVDLKRKVEYQNSHKKQLINPRKCFKMLELLKRRGNPYYQFYDDYQTYTERCKKADAIGYSYVFDEDTEQILDITEKVKKSGEICDKEIKDNEYLSNDPVRKYQLDDYNKSLCMSNMYPEMGPENSLIVAPGEGKTPQNILLDDDWDIQAFPHLNSPDGKYGLHYEREKRLSSQYYFIQRICNQNPKFIKKSILCIRSSRAHRVEAIAAKHKLVIFQGERIRYM